MIEKILDTLDKYPKPMAVRFLTYTNKKGEMRLSVTTLPGGTITDVDCLHKYFSLFTNTPGVWEISPQGFISCTFSEPLPFTLKLLVSSEE